MPFPARPRRERSGALPPRITTAGEPARVQGLRGLATRLANGFGAPLGRAELPG
ncbi:hypothetical protein ACH4CE_13060 [Streptomyces gelaticus]|uniref:hypothetical protein n=1 Tax=Streptomyces gelaticus TaxID=285446 RepID=UPI0037A19E8C